MKIAISFRGQPRDYLRGYEFINRELLSKYNGVDVFGHTWWDENRIGEKYDTHNHSANIGYTIEKDIPKKLENLYHFKKLGIQKPKEFKPSREYNNGKLYSGLNSQYYSLKKGIEYIESYELLNGLRYDFVIITRWDIYSEKPFINLYTLNPSKIYACGVDSSNEFYDPLIICGANINGYLKIFLMILIKPMMRYNLNIMAI